MLHQGQSHFCIITKYVELIVNQCCCRSLSPLWKSWLIRGTVHKKNKKQIWPKVWGSNHCNTLQFYACVRHVNMCPHQFHIRFPFSKFDGLFLSHSSNLSCKVTDVHTCKRVIGRNFCTNLICFRHSYDVNFFFFFFPRRHNSGRRKFPLLSQKKSSEAIYSKMHMVMVGGKYLSWAKSWTQKNTTASHFNDRNSIAPASSQTIFSEWCYCPLISPFQLSFEQTVWHGTCIENKQRRTAEARRWHSHGDIAPFLALNPS